ncbi:MAG: hypothetical protein ACREJ2_01290 [Planctomycetota bacterium]
MRQPWTAPLARTALAGLAALAPLVALAALLFAAGCDEIAAPPPLAIRVLPSTHPPTVLEPYFPEVAKTHVALTYSFDPGTGITDPTLLLPPTPNARWLLGYLGQNVSNSDMLSELSLPIPNSQRPPLRGELVSVELWLSHAESIYAADYCRADEPGVHLRYSPWVETYGPGDWKMGQAAENPLQDSRLIEADGRYLPTGSSFDLALHSPPGSVAFFGVVGEFGQVVGLTRDGRLYLSADRKLVTPFGALEGLYPAAIPAGVNSIAMNASGTVTGSQGNEDQKTNFSFGPVRVYLVPIAAAQALHDENGFYPLDDPGSLPSPVLPSEQPGLLHVAQREQSRWTAAWFYDRLRSIAEARALVASVLERMDEALIREQTAPPPVKLEVKTDTAPFEKILRDWAAEQAGGRRHPPIRFRQDKRMILSRAYFAARKAPIRHEGDDILLDFPPPDPNNPHGPVDQTAGLLADCAKFLDTRMHVIQDNVAHMYDIVETVQIGAEKIPRKDRAPHRVALDENTAQYKIVPIDKPFRTKLMPGNPNAIDAQGTVYFPNVNASDEVAEYNNLANEYQFILKALAAVDPDTILEPAQPLTLPPKPADWQE